MPQQAIFLRLTIPLVPSDRLPNFCGECCSYHLRSEPFFWYIKLCILKMQLGRRNSLIESIGTTCNTRIFIGMLLWTASNTVVFFSFGQNYGRIIPRKICIYKLNYSTSVKVRIFLFLWHNSVRVFSLFQWQCVDVDSHLLPSLPSVIFPLCEF